MSSDIDRLDPVDEAIVERLAVGQSHAQVAGQLDISTKTIQRRLKDPAFAAAVSDRRRERLAVTAAQLVTLGDEAVRALEGMLSSDDERVRLQAVRMVLDHGRRYHRDELFESEFARRLEALEEPVDQSSSSVSESGASDA